MTIGMFPAWNLKESVKLLWEEYFVGSNREELVEVPGSTWNYNSGCAMLLAGIIKNTTGIALKTDFGMPVVTGDK